jgi:hypothetical protein
MRAGGYRQSPIFATRIMSRRYPVDTAPPTSSAPTGSTGYEGEETHYFQEQAAEAGYSKTCGSPAPNVVRMSKALILPTANCQK